MFNDHQSTFCLTTRMSLGALGRNGADGSIVVLAGFAMNGRTTEGAYTDPSNTSQAAPW